jgi:hypothetical protein
MGKINNFGDEIFHEQPFGIKKLFFGTCKELKWYILKIFSLELK